MPGFADKTYAYTVIPGLTAGEMAGYENPMTVLRNDATVQAVEHAGAGLTQAAYHSAGTLSWNDRTLAANIPCLTQLRRSENELYLAASSPEAAATTAALTTTGPQGTWSENLVSSASLSIGLPGGDLAGSTAGLRISRDDAVSPA